MPMYFSRLRRTLVASLLLPAAALLEPAAHAADPWPTKPIQLVIPYPPGGSADLLGRPLALQLQQQLGQPVVLGVAGASPTFAALLTAGVAVLALFTVARNIPLS